MGLDIIFAWRTKGKVGTVFRKQLREVATEVQRDRLLCRYNFTEAKSTEAGDDGELDFSVFCVKAAS